MKTDEALRAFVDAAETYTPRPNGGASSASIPYVLFADTRPVLTNLWLIKGVLPRRGVAVIYGPSGEGKTFVALDLLLHIARGAAWRGRRTTGAGVLYLAPDGGSIVANRVDAYRRHYGVAAADLVIVSAPVDLLGKVSAGDLGKVEVLIAHVERVHGIRIAVVAVDTVSRAMPGGDENQPADMSRFVDNLGRLSAGDERLIVGVHHTPKADGTVLRGHSSLHGAADCELNVVDQTIRVAKQRDGQDGLQFGFRLEVIEIGHDEDGDPVTSCVAVASDVAARAAKRITGAASIALRLLHNAIIGAGETPPACTHIPPNIRAVQMELWRRYCDSGQISDGTPDAKRKAFKRAAARLQELGAIGVWSDWVWPADNRT
jgi:AAA domain